MLHTAITATRNLTVREIVGRTHATEEINALEPVTLQELGTNFQSTKHRKLGHIYTYRPTCQ
jgi:hypothetical protein